MADAYLDLGDAVGRANAGDKLLTLVASALAGGDCIDDAAALRAGGTASVLGCTVKAPSTLGTFLRSFRWGHVRQLDRVSRALLARAWAPERDPAPRRSRSTSTRRSVRPTAWLRRAPATTATRACAAITRCSPSARLTCARLREGRANTDRETVAARCRSERAADDAPASTTTRSSPPAARWMRSASSRRTLIEATARGLDADPVLAAVRRRCAETTYTPFRTRGSATVGSCGA